MRHSILYLEDNFTYNNLSSLVKGKYFSFYNIKNYHCDLFSYNIRKTEGFYNIANKYTNYTYGYTLLSELGLTCINSGPIDGPLNRTTDRAVESESSGGTR